jgi:hypothetical protein
VAKYIGMGSTDDATNFVCVEERDNAALNAADRVLSEPRQGDDRDHGHGDDHGHDRD